MINVPHSSRLLASPALGLLLLATFAVPAAPVAAQAATQEAAQSATPTTTPVPTSMTEPAVDEAYSAAIREFTTEDFFLTPLVDHVPASSTVPSPLDHLGHISGAPDILSYPEEIHGYMRAVAAASPRVQVFTIGETEEGREMIVTVVSDEETMARLEEHKDMLRRLNDPRITSAAEAEEIIGTAKPIYWATGAIHSPETGSPEMLMEMVYRLATGESEYVRDIREGLIFMTTPVVEVDGRAKVVDLHMAQHRDPELNVPSRPLYWGKYVAHDNNRDNIGLGLKLSQNVTNTFMEYHPTVFHDLHESATYLYTSTGRGPYNAWLDPVVINEWNRLAYKEVKDMTALGVPGVYTFDFYDGWGANYMMWVAHMRNGIGRFYETQGARDASYYVVSSRTQREWHRPSIPLDEVVWGIRNNVNLQQSALLVALHEVATNREEFLRNNRLKAERSVAKARAEGPAAYVFPADDPRPGQQARLLRLMQLQKFEVHRLEEDVELGEGEEARSFAEGSYVVRMDQPYSRGADMLLDKQYYNPNDPRPYDDTGWTVGPLFDAETVRVEDAGILDAEMSRVEADVWPEGGVTGDGDYYLLAYDADNELVQFRYGHPELDIQAAERSFQAEGRSFPAGSWIVRAGTDDATRRVLEHAAGEHGFRFVGTNALPAVPSHPVAAPRVAVMHTWASTQNEGWVRMALDEYGVPYDYVSVHDVRDEPDLRSRWDVILTGPSSSDALDILRGIEGDEPIVWKATEVTPNIGRQDETDDMRGGLELTGVMNLKTFLDEGGVLLTITSSSSLPVHFGMAADVRMTDPEELWAPGGVFRVEKQAADHPLAYGLGDDLGVYFDGDPVFSTGRGFGSWGGSGGGGEEAGPGSTTERRTGRGGPDEEDIVQGRARHLGDAGVEAFRAREEEDDEDEDEDEDEESEMVTVFSFADQPEDVLISGGVVNPALIAGAPALIDVRHGEGHVVLFSFNPMWRSHTHGAYATVFNALLNYGNLRVAPPQMAADGQDAAGGS